VTDQRKPVIGSVYTNPEDPTQRPIRSFVLRQGHLSEAQLRSIDEGMPQWGIDYQPVPLDLHSLFGRQVPKVLEIGFGMGTATAEIAARRPDTDFLGVEVHGPGVGNLLKLIDERGLTNLRIIRHDAVEVVDHMLPPQSLDGFHLYFPDPWPKKRHHKRRLGQPLFIDKIVSRMKHDAYLHLATDWEEYAQQMLVVLSQHPQLRNTAHGFAERPVFRPLTKFEQRGLNLGHGVWDLLFKVVR